MKVSSLTGAATTNRTTPMQLVTPASTGGVTTARVRPLAVAPPPRSSSFGGADPWAMFEALVQSFDRNGDGKLSLGEVNALNQGGLLARSFTNLDSNADGAISGDEIAARAPWAAGLQLSRDQNGAHGINLRPLINGLADHLTNPRAAGISFSNPNAGRQSDLADAADRAAQSPMVQDEPASLMESMVRAMATRATPPEG